MLVHIDWDVLSFGEQLLKLVQRRLFPGIHGLAHSLDPVLRRFDNQRNLVALLHVDLHVGPFIEKVFHCPKLHLPFTQWGRDF